MKKLLLTLFVVFALVGCTETTTTTTYPTMSYLSFLDDHIDEVNQQLTQDEDTYYIYIYGPQCSACLGIKNEALYTIEFLTNDTVYFVEATSTSQLDANIVSVGQARYPNGFGTPALAKVIDGEVVDVFVGGTDVLTELHRLS